MQDEDDETAVEDWGESYDDLDPSYWEDHFGGRDEPSVEEEYQQHLAWSEAEFGHEVDEKADDIDDASWDDYYACEAKYIEQAWAAYKLEEILFWLEDSGFAKPLSKGGSFFVASASRGRLRDGRVVNVVDWLKEIGIVPGISVAGLSVSQDRSTSDLRFTPDSAVDAETQSPYPAGGAGSSRPESHKELEVLRFKKSGLLLVFDRMLTPWGSGVIVAYSVFYKKLRRYDATVIVDSLTKCRDPLELKKVIDEYLAWSSTPQGRKEIRELTEQKPSESLSKM